MKNKGRAVTEWVPIGNVIPNPLNPRKNDAIKTEEMQAIIKKRGWEEPLTVYKKNHNYIVLAGHRRLYAAKQAGMKEIPVYVVETPVNHQEEIERIASLQRGRVDWTPYEWGKFTYERWIAWGKPALPEFSKKINIPRATVGDYITVLDYYPREEVETKLQSGVYSMNLLSTLVMWLKRLKDAKPELVADMTEELIRRVMLNKIENGRVGRDSIRRMEIFGVASDKDMKEFLTTSNMDLQELLDIYGVDKPTKTFQGRLISIGRANGTMGEIEVPASRDEQEKLVHALEQMQETLKKKVREIKKVQREQEERTERRREMLSQSR